MFENLKKLIFEEIDDEEEEEEEVVVPVKPVKKTREKIQTSAPVFEQKEVAKPSMKRIDVTQQIKTPVVPSYEEKKVSTPKESVFRPTTSYEKAEPVMPKTVQTERPRSASLTLDDLSGSQTTSKPRTNKVTTQKQIKKLPYEFNPVISPIFGVDEKDVNAVQNTGKSTVRKSTSSKKGDDLVSKVISPMYGINKDDQPSTVQKTVEKSNKAEKMSVTKEKVEAEEAIPEFSLDDILNGNDRGEESKRDEKFENTLNELKAVSEEVVIDEPRTNTAPPLPKKKPVFDSATLFDDDED